MGPFVGKLEEIKVLTLIALATSLVASQESADCMAKQRFDVIVQAIHGDISILESFKIAEIEMIAKDLKRTSRHPIRGFYVGWIGYNATLDPVLDDPLLGAAGW
jgi:hypothetical protein